MEAKSAKVSDNGQKIVVALKRKRAAHYAHHFSRAARMTPQQYAMASPSKKHHKKVRSGSCKNRCGTHFNRTLLTNYSNFMKSRLPQRLMVYQYGSWTDFPEGFIRLAKEDFRLKKAVSEVGFEGQTSVLDFVHMIQIDLKTGLQHPIAWIDEGGSCFFPALYSESDELHECFQDRDGKNSKILSSEPNGTPEIELQLEIELNAADSSNDLDCVEGSNMRAVKRKVEGKPASHQYYMEQDESSGESAEIKKDNGENNGISHSQNCILESLDEKISPDNVQKMFLQSMASPCCASNILEVERCSSTLAQARFELFQKQVEITKKYRGNANVRYAWFSSSKDAVSRILTHGLGVDGLTKTRSRYGLGVHLTPADFSSISANYHDVDENGVQYMFLCHVIMGNMELVHPGSDQFYPSSEHFDSGVDDLQKPKQYVVWNVNMNTHIFPEYVVSFRAPVNEKGYLVPNQSRVNASVVTISSSWRRELQESSPFDTMEGSHPRGLNLNVGPAFPDVSKSPRMPFSFLFAAVKDKVSPQAMESVNFQYNLYKMKVIDHQGLVRKLRSIIGDTLLKSTVISLWRSKFGAGVVAAADSAGDGSAASCVTVVPKQERET